MIKKVENIILVGTSHISNDSVVRIKESIEKYDPEVIAIELDYNRLRSLLSKKKMTFKDKLSLIKKIGIFGFLFYIVASSVQQRISKKTGLKPGIDMLTAYNLSREKKKILKLIDLPIEITLSKFKNIPFHKKISLVLKLLFKSNSKENKELLNFDVKKIPKDELILKIIELIKKEAPIIYKILIENRNMYMCNQLIQLSQKHKGKIIAVVGAAHVDGMTRILEEKFNLIKFENKEINEGETVNINNYNNLEYNYYFE